MSTKYKYPRTYHVPFSEGLQNDDRLIESMEYFEGEEVVITEKLDGENTTIGDNYTHARSMDSLNHESRTWLKQFAVTFQYMLPNGNRVCGENVYAKHSILYNELLTYFYGFSLWNETVCLSWDETLDFFNKAGIISVPVIYRGKFDINILHDIANEIKTDSNKEGFVCRITNSFDIIHFDTYICKWVRKNHVQTSKHWMNEAIIKNKLKGE
jgi:hypothetical protein